MRTGSESVVSPVTRPAPNLRAHGALLLVQLCFAAFPTLGKVALRELTPFTLVTFRVATAAGVFILLSMRQRRERLPLPPGLVRELFVLSLLGVTINQLLFVQGLHSSSALKGGLLVALIPPFTYLVAIKSRAEAPSSIRLLGVTLAFLGTALLLVVDDAGNFVSFHQGDLYYLGNALVYAIYLVRVRSVLARIGSLRVLAWIFGLAGLTLLPLAPLAELRLPLTPPGWWALALILVFPTVIAYWGNAYALKSLPSSVIGVYVALQPGIATLIAALALGEKAGWRELLMVVCVALGLLLVSRGRENPRRRAT